MKSTPKPTAEYTNFENAMRAILRALKADVQRELEREKQQRATHGLKRGPKPKNASGHVSGGKD